MEAYAECPYCDHVVQGIHDQDAKTFLNKHIRKVHPGEKTL